MSSYNNIIAKSNGTSLKKHSFDSLKIMSIILESNKELFINKLNLLNISDYEDLFLNLKKASFFHDFGKATIHWQKKINTIKCENDRLPAHALNSGYFINPDLNNMNEVMVLLSIISHHTLLTENSFEYNVNYSPKFYDDFLVKLTNETNFNTRKFSSFRDYLNFLINFKSNSQSYELRKLFDATMDIKFKAHYCLFLSYLTLVDGLSSEFEEKNIEISKNEIIKKHPTSKIIYDVIKKIDDKKLTSIQSLVYDVKCENNSNDLIKPILMEAPCGEGKTLASLIFSKILLKNNLINNVIFVLPTQVTSNNMYFEFEKEYGIPKEWLGIYHSEVLNFLIKNNDEAYNPEIDKYKNVIYSKVFNISTIDHLLLTLVNGYKHAPRAFGNILNSLIIIDELHYYDSHTLALIELLCEILRFLKIPHIIMSATIPKFIKNLFGGENYHKIQSSGCDFNNVEKNPFKFSYYSSNIYDGEYFSDGFLEILKNNIDNNLGIIVNTVPMSKKIFEDIKSLYPNKQVLLYNSQFMKKDRPIKERIIKAFSNILYNMASDEDRELLISYNFKPDDKFIFIGTQVAEISLNMSFDTLITQLAPFDAIIQRGGRLHRKMTFNNSKECDCIQCSKLNNNHEFILHVFDTGEFCYPYFTKNDEINECKYNIINNTRKVLKDNPKYTFKNSIELMNKVYDDDSFLIDENVKNNYREKIEEDLIFGKSPSFSEENGGQLRIQTRNINSMSVSALPNCFLYDGDFIIVTDFINKIYEKHNYDEKFTKLGLNILFEHMISVSYKFFKANNGQSYQKGGYTFNIIDLSYNFDIGLFEDDCFLE